MEMVPEQTPKVYSTPIQMFVVQHPGNFFENKLAAEIKIVLNVQAPFFSNLLFKYLVHLILVVFYFFVCSSSPFPFLLFIH
jgi:hypothetical protein